MDKALNKVASASVLTVISIDSWSRYAVSRVLAPLPTEDSYRSRRRPIAQNMFHPILPSMPRSIVNSIYSYGTNLRRCYNNSILQ